MLNNLNFKINRVFIERAEIGLASFIVGFVSWALPKYFEIEILPITRGYLLLFPIVFLSSFVSKFSKKHLKSILEGVYSLLLILAFFTALHNQFNVSSFFIFILSILFASTSTRNDTIFLVVNIPIVLLFILEYTFYNIDYIITRSVVYIAYLIAIASGFAITKIRGIVLKRSEEKNKLLIELFNSSKSGLILYNIDKQFVRDLNLKAEKLLNLQRYENIKLEEIQFKSNFIFKNKELNKEYSIETIDKEILKIELKEIMFNQDQYYLISFELYENLYDLSQTEEFKKLKEISEDAYYNLYDTNDSLIVILSEECKILDCNNTFLSSFNLNAKKNAIGKSINDFIHERDNYFDKTKCQSYVNSDGPIEVEFKFNNQSSVFLELLFSKGKFLDQKVVILNARNISKRVRLEKELKIFYDRYKYVTNESSIGFLVGDLEGNIIETNQAFCKFLGYSKSELLSMHIKDIAPEEDTKITLDLRKKLIEGEIKSSETIKKYLRKDGSIVHSIFTLLLQKDLNNKPQFFFAQIVDISAIKKAQKELEISEKSYRDLFNNSEELLYILNKDHQFIDVNNAVIEKYGHQKEDIIGKTPILFSAPDMNDIDHVLKGMNEVWKGKKFNTLWWSQKIDGSIFPKELRFNKGIYKNQEVLIATGIDISESFEYESKLKEKERRYRNLFERNLAGVYRSNINGDIIECNPSYLEILGFEKEDYQRVKINVNDFYLSKNDRESIINKIEKQNFLKDQKLKLKRKDGSIITVLLNSIVIKNEKGLTEYYEGNLIDISKQELIEIELKRSQQNYYDLINSSAFGIIIIRKEKIIFSNQKACDILGFSHGLEILERKPYDILLEEDKELYDKQFKELRANIDIPFSRYVIKKKNGYLIDVECKPSIIEYEGKNCILFSFIDISDKKKIKEVEEKIIATEKFNNVLKSKLNEKEVLLKEIHHRVKNNMQIISSILNLQLGFVKEDSIRNILKDSQNRIGSMAQIHEMLYSTKDFASVPFDEYLLNLAKKLLSSFDSEGASPKLEYQFDKVILTIDQAIPCGLIANELISNALKYAFIDVENPIISLSLQMETELVKIQIGDNGKGLPKDFAIDNLKSLGLQLVETLVQQLNGRLEVESNNGASFTIFFNKIS